MPKEPIFEATWELIKAEGIENVTARKIAARAQVNIASINYYFGSKEQLINEVIKRHLEAFREAFQVLDDTEIPPLVRLRRFLLAYASVLLEYPELAKHLLSQAELFASEVEYKAFLKHQGFEKLVATIMDIVGQEPHEKVLLMIRQMAGAIFFPLVFKGGFNPTSTASLLDTVPPLEEQIDLFLARYFSAV